MEQQTFTVRHILWFCLSPQFTFSYCNITTYAVYTYFTRTDFLVKDNLVGFETNPLYNY